MRPTCTEQHHSGKRRARRSAHRTHAAPAQSMCTCVRCEFGTLAGCRRRCRPCSVAAQAHHRPSTLQAARSCWRSRRWRASRTLRHCARPCSCTRKQSSRRHTGAWAACRRLYSTPARASPAPRRPWRKGCSMRANTQRCARALRCEVVSAACMRGPDKRMGRPARTNGCEEAQLGHARERPGLWGRRC